MATRNPSEEPARTAPEAPAGEADDRTARRDRRRRRAREARLQSIVRKLANRPAIEPEG